MPYLDEEWHRRGGDEGDEDIPAGLWVPEKDWKGWKTRGIGLSYRDMWDRDRVVTRAELEKLASLSPGSRELYLSVLGQDLGSIQRDSLFYSNWIEQLKRSPNDATADAVFDAMDQLNFASVQREATTGGPPKSQSPRPFNKMLNWLLGLLVKVGKIILKVADALIAMMSEKGVDLSVSIGAFPPSFGVDVSTTLFKQEHSTAWDSLHRFLEQAQNELAKEIDK